MSRPLPVAVNGYLATGGRTSIAIASEGYLRPGSITPEQAFRIIGINNEEDIWSKKRKREDEELMLILESFVLLN